MHEKRLPHAWLIEQVYTYQTPSRRDLDCNRDAGKCMFESTLPYLQLTSYSV